MTAFAIFGLGEVGSIFARDLRAAGASRVAGYDIAADARARAAAAGHLSTCETIADALRGADVVFSSVTAGSALDAARSLSGRLDHQPFVVDVNSVSPGVRRKAHAIVSRAGGRYVEAAIMTSVPPRGLRSPMLLGGPHAADWMATMAPFGLAAELFSEEVGGASAVKMCRSIMVKGLEALAGECMLAARHYGVEGYVLDSLADTLPHPDWPELARYLISRSVIHGRRRAEEMAEVALTVEGAGLHPTMSRAAEARQSWAHRHGRSRSAAAWSEASLLELLDGLSASAKLAGNHHGEPDGRQAPKTTDGQTRDALEGSLP